MDHLEACRRATGVPITPGCGGQVRRRLAMANYARTRRLTNSEIGLARAAQALGVAARKPEAAGWGTADRRGNATVNRRSDTSHRASIAWRHREVDKPGCSPLKQTLRRSDCAHKSAPPPSSQVMSRKSLIKYSVSGITRSCALGRQLPQGELLRRPLLRFHSKFRIT